MTKKYGTLEIDVINSSQVTLQTAKIKSLTQEAWTAICYEFLQSKTNLKFSSAHLKHIQHILKNKKMDLSIVFLNPKEARDLNFEHRGKKYATDILSFQGEFEFLYPAKKTLQKKSKSMPARLSLGELVLCPQVLQKQAKEHKLSFDEELRYMLIHGLLHLLSLDHERSAREESFMFEIQDRIFFAQKGKKKLNNSQAPDPLSLLEKLKEPKSPLNEAYQIGVASHKLDFDWENPKQVLKKVKEEFKEVKEAFDSGDLQHIEEEIGDLFFALSQFARHLKLDPEECSRKANKKFLKRFVMMFDICKELQIDYFHTSSAEKEDLWTKAKRRVRQTSAF